jgi:hypothetical protein
MSLYYSMFNNWTFGQKFEARPSARFHFFSGGRSACLDGMLDTVVLRGRSVDFYRRLPSVHTYNLSASLFRDTDITHL